MSSVGTRFVVPAAHTRMWTLPYSATHASRSRSSEPTSLTSDGTPDRSPAASLDLGRDRVDERLAPAGGDDVGAGVREPERQRAADAARAADDDGPSAGQIENGRGSGRRCAAVLVHMSEAIIRQGQCPRMGGQDRVQGSKVLGFYSSRVWFYGCRVRTRAAANAPSNPQPAPQAVARAVRHPADPRPRLVVDMAVDPRPVTARSGRVLRMTLGSARSWRRTARRRPRARQLRRPRASTSGSMVVGDGTRRSRLADARATSDRRALGRACS